MCNGWLARLFPPALPRLDRLSKNYCILTPLCWPEHTIFHHNFARVIIVYPVNFCPTVSVTGEQNREKIECFDVYKLILTTTGKRKETKGKANAQDGWNDVSESKEFLTTVFFEQGLAEELNNGNRLKRSLVPTVTRVTRVTRVIFPPSRR